MRRWWIVPAGLLLAVMALAGCRKNAEFVEHPRPEYTVDISPFGRAGCDLNPATGIISCIADSPISQMGCQYLRSSDLLGGLDPGHPIVGCAGSCEGDYLYAAGDNTCVHLVAYAGESFQLISSQADLQALYAPIDSADEAFSYAVAATPYHARFGADDYLILRPDGSPSPAADYRYYVDTIEDTAVTVLDGGYDVNLFSHRRSGCSPHPVFSIVVRVGTDGTLTESDPILLYDEGLDENSGWCVE